MCVWIGMFVGLAHNKPIKQLKTQFYKQKNTLNIEIETFWNWMELEKNKTYF